MRMDFFYWIKEKLSRIGQVVLEKFNPKEAPLEILVPKKCKKLLMKLIIGNKLVLSDQEMPDKIPEHYIDEEFHVQSEYCIYSDQFPTIHDII